MNSISVKVKNGKINFSCCRNQCSKSCCGPFCGISNEIESIDGRPFEEIVLTDEDYQAIYEAGYSDLIEEGYSEIAGKPYYKMALHEDGTCKALVNGTCVLHDYNPTLCKAFPFYYDMFAGLCMIICDGVSDENWTELEQYRPYIDAATKMYRFWLDFYGAD